MTGLICVDQTNFEVETIFFLHVKPLFSRLMLDKFVSVLRQFFCLQTCTRIFISISCEVIENEVRSFDPATNH